MQMDGVGKKEDNVLVLGATNRPWELDEAIRRRFEKRVFISLPGWEARSKMAKIHLRNASHNLTERDFDKLGQMTEGASGSDMKVLVKKARHEPLNKCGKAQQFLPIGKYLVPCEQYPNCLYCPPKLSADPPNKNYDCCHCGAKRMQMWDVPDKKLKTPDVCVKDFENVLRRHSHSTVAKRELEKYEDWTNEFGEEGA